MLQSCGTLCCPESEAGGWGGLQVPVLRESKYRGERTADGECRVWIESTHGAGKTVERSELPLHLEIRSHSPTGFAWGYGGSGPAQLALALLMDALADREMAERHYQEFKRAHVATWKDQWSITAEEIRFFVLRQATKEPKPGPARFAPGAIVSTPGVLTRVPPDELLLALSRHLSGDWGELDEHDWQVNEEALRDGSRLLSAYVASNGTKFWIITESDRTVTTSLLPDEY